MSLCKRVLEDLEGSVKQYSEIAHKNAKSYVDECKHYGYYIDHDEYETRYAEELAELVAKHVFKTTITFQLKELEVTLDDLCVRI